MKLLFDEQLAPKLARQLSHTFPDSVHVNDVGLDQVDDRRIWTHARDNGFVIVTKDADFTDIATAWGHPPKLIWIRLGNCTTGAILDLLRAQVEAIQRLDSDPDLGTLVLG